MLHSHNTFKDFGGHEMSGGFSLTDEQVLLFQENLELAFMRLVPKEQVLENRNDMIDGLLTIAEANEVAYHALRDLAPFGQGNRKPLFRIESTRVEKLFRFGASSEHARMLLSDDSGRSLEAISFFVSRQPFRDTLELVSLGDVIDVEGSIEQSFFRGSKEIRFRLDHLAFTL